jgi:hypothetical protein
MVISGYIFGHRLTLALLRCLVTSECLVIGVLTLNWTTSQRERKYATGYPLFKFPFHIGAKFWNKKSWLVIRGWEPGLNPNWGGLGKITAQP